MDIHSLRKDYKSPVLRKKNLCRDPFRQFELWFTEACNKDVHEPNAMTLATVSTEGQPSQRTVLLKIFDQRGFVFYTNYNSRKAREIACNPQVSLLFPWVPMERQVTITGTAAAISPVESARYFATRPRESQLGAWISNQSDILNSRDILMSELEKAKQRFSKGKIPRPDFWGGFRVRPETIEFWQGRTSRLHDRFLYTKVDDHAWSLVRLAP